MSYLKVIIPAIVLTGCSAGPNYSSHQGQSENAYSQPCGYTACSSPYSTGETDYSHSGHHYAAQPHSAPAYQSQGHYPQEAYVQESYVQDSYVQAGPAQAHYPSAHHGQGYGNYQQPSPHAYGTQTAPYGAPQNHYGHNNQPLNLRGAYGQPRRGYKYATLGASMYDVDSDVFGIQGRVGYQSASIFGAELEAFTGLTKEKETIGATTVRAGVDYTVGAFGVLRTHLTPKFAVHSRAGYHATDISGDVTTGGVRTDVDLDTQDGFAYGVGAEYAVSPRDFIRADYTVYDQDLGKNNSVSIAYGRKF